MKPKIALTSSIVRSFCRAISTLVLFGGIANGSDAIIPQPQKVSLASGEFVFEDGLSVYADKASSPVAKWLKGRVANSTGFGFTTSRTLEKAQISLRVKSGMEPEAYAIKVEKQKIRIIGGSEAGVFYGCQTLCQLLPPVANRGLQQGYKTIISPADFIYFDYPYVKGELGGTWEGLRNGGNSTELIYNWQPV